MAEWLDFFNTYRAPTQHLISVLLAAAIWRWGGSPERWLAGVFVMTMVLPIYVARALGVGPLEVGPYAGVQVLLDLAAVAVFVIIALNANRNYPLWIAGFQLVAVGAHMVRALVDSISPLSFAILVIGPSYGQLLALSVGFARHRLRERRFGPYRAWRSGSPGLGWVRP